MPLNSRIKELITKNGSISIAQFMTEAVSDYYQKQEPFGSEGDFITAPEISQIFGEMIGIWCASMWQQMGSPASTLLVEIGPGRGTLMKDLLRGTKNVPGFHEAMEIHMVEASSRLEGVQREVLHGAHDNIMWHKNISYVPEGAIIVVANELFDALPIHQYEKTNEGWRERMIALGEGGLEYVLSPVLAFSNDIEAEHGRASIGGVVEVCQSGISIAKDVAGRIVRCGGAAVFIDYGYDYYGYKDTLQALKNHKYHSVLEDVGEADITAHVDFIALSKVARDMGVQVFDIVTQRDFLMPLGVELRRDMLIKNASPEQKKEIFSGIERLISLDEMGSLFKVLVMSDSA